MTWFLVDDSFAFHRKVRRAGNQAIGLWVRAGSYSCQQLTDGVIETDMIEALGGKERDAQRLVAAGLWVVHPDGYAFYKWPRKLTRAAIEEQRAANRVRMNNQRSARGVQTHNDGTADAVQVPSPSPVRTGPLSQDEREPTAAQQRILKARGARSPAAVWKNASEEERESIRKEARALTVVRAPCPHHPFELIPCRSCAGEAKGATA